MGLTRVGKKRHVGKKGSDTKSAKHPKGRSGFWCLTPFSRPTKDGL